MKNDYLGFARKYNRPCPILRRNWSPPDGLCISLIKLHAEKVDLMI